jgi:phosphotriesterase-related protein
MMNRRLFLKTGAAVLGAAAIGPASSAKSHPPARTPLGQAAAGPSDDVVMTVTGPVRPSALGTTLPHEHVLVDFVGAASAGPERYDRNEVYQRVLPFVEELASAGGQTMMECTPAFLGRDPELLRRLAEATGVQIVTNTGYYGARDDQHVPEHARSASADALAARWISEWDEGIGDTGIRPGFIKIGVDSGPLSALDEKLVRAACRTHLETGLTIASHTGPAQPAFEQLQVLAEEGIDPSAWIWVHAQNEDDIARHVEAARRGAWVEFDGYEPAHTTSYVQRLTAMRERDLLDRVLVSHDNGWYSVGEPDGGDFQPYTPLFTALLPALRAAGFSDEEVRQLVVTNPAEAFTVRVRRP